MDRVLDPAEVKAWQQDVNRELKQLNAQLAQMVVVQEQIGNALAGQKELFERMRSVELYIAGAEGAKRGTRDFRAVIVSVVSAIVTAGLIALFTHGDGNAKKAYNARWSGGSYHGDSSVAPEQLRRD